MVNFMHLFHPFLFKKGKCIVIPTREGDIYRAILSLSLYHLKENVQKLQNFIISTELLVICHNPDG
jgi:hypothetical protein